MTFNGSVQTVKLHELTPDQLDVAPAGRFDDGACTRMCTCAVWNGERCDAIVDTPGTRVITAWL